MLPNSELLALKVEKDKLTELIIKLEKMTTRAIVRGSAALTTITTIVSTPSREDIFLNFPSKEEIPPEYFEFLQTYKTRLVKERADIWRRIEALTLEKK